MTADTAPEPSTEQPGPNSANGAPRHLHPVPTNEPVQNEPAAQSTEEDNNTVEDIDEQPAETEPSPTGSSRVDLTALLAWGRATFTPDSGLFSTRPLAVDEVLDRARRGSQLADAGPLRAVSTVHGYAAAGVKVALRSIDWIVEHLARTAVGLVLLTALLLYPPTRMVLGYALTPAVWAHDLLT